MVWISTDLLILCTTIRIANPHQDADLCVPDNFAPLNARNATDRSLLKSLSVYARRRAERHQKNVGYITIVLSPIEIGFIQPFYADFIIRLLHAQVP